jgi:cellulose synthase/poly-beta-1,6-N-acetylglucosamine synthase-like glycosyltransferase
METGNTKKPVGADGRHPPLGIDTAKMHIKACVDFYCKRTNDPSFRHLSGIFTHPRGTDMKSFESNIQTRCRIAAEDAYVDPGVGSIHDGYTANDLRRIVKTYMELRTNRHGNLRDRMVFLMNNNMLLRGEISRGLQLNLISHLLLEDEGPTRCPCLVFMYNWGKNNPKKITQYSGAIRHKDVNVCAFGAVGLYLFFRFHVENEPFPDFTNSEIWFDIKLVKGSNRLKPIAATTQTDSVTKIFDACGISSKKKTHSGRGSGARTAEQSGMSAKLIRQMGKWLKGSMEKSYLNTLPYSAIRVMNGFHSDRGSFYLPRALVTPSESLQKRIFPLADQWLEKMNNGEVLKTISGIEFLNLLVELRVFILQDAVESRFLIYVTDIISEYRYIYLYLSCFLVTFLFMVTLMFSNSVTFLETYHVFYRLKCLPEIYVCSLTT